MVPVYEVGVQDGAPFIAMRYVPGRDLARLLRDEAPLSPATTLRYVGQVAAALDAAHRRGLLQPVAGTSIDPSLMASPS